MGERKSFCLPERICGFALVSVTRKEGRATSACSSLSPLDARRRLAFPLLWEGLWVRNHGATSPWKRTLPLEQVLILSILLHPSWRAHTHFLISVLVGFFFLDSIFQLVTTKTWHASIPKRYFVQDTVQDSIRPQEASTPAMLIGTPKVHTFLRGLKKDLGFHTTRFSCSSSPLGGYFP